MGSQLVDRSLIRIFDIQTTLIRRRFVNNAHDCIPQLRMINAQKRGFDKKVKRVVGFSFDRYHPKEKNR